MRPAYEKGNRLPVPAELKSSHFIYKAAPLRISQEDIAKVVAATQAFVDNRGLNPAQIEVFTPKEFQREAADAYPALVRLFQALGFDEPTPGAGVLVCEWAAPHVDDSYEGAAFVSLVLHTGPEPYVMQTFHAEHRPGAVPQLTASTRVLRSGDCFVFDPTTPHMAMPLHPHQDQLLVMLQVELPDNTELERSALLQRFKRHEEDRDNGEVFNGYGF